MVTFLIFIGVLLFLWLLAELLNSVVKDSGKLLQSLNRIFTSGPMGFVVVGVPLAALIFWLILR